MWFWNDRMSRSTSTALVLENLCAASIASLLDPFSCATHAAKLSLLRSTAGS